jgi:sugar lactone lactonase YvrE
MNGTIPGFTDLFGRSVCVGVALLITASARGQNLFADSGDTVYEYSSTGVQSVFAIGLSSAAGLAFDSEGDLFVADTGSGDVYEYTPGGVRSTFASGLNQPSGLAFDASGILYVSQLAQPGYPVSGSPGSIISITPTGVQHTYASNLNPNPRGSGLAFDSSGSLFVTDRGDGSIDQAGHGLWADLSAEGLGTPYGLAGDSAGHLFASTVSGVYEFGPGAMPYKLVASGSFAGAPLAFDNANDLFAASSDGIYEIYPDGTETTFAAGLNAGGLAFQPVPEPSAFSLLAICFGSFSAWNRRRR